MPLIVQPNFKLAAQDVEEFLAFMCVGFAAASAGLDAEKMRLHGGIAPGQKLHADFRTGFKDFALRRANQRLGVPVRFKHGKDIGFVKARNALERGDGRAHLAAFESAEKANRNLGGARNVSERKAALHAQTAEPLARRLQGVRRRCDDSLLLQNMYNRGRI